MGVINEKNTETEEELIKRLNTEMFCLMNSDYEYFFKRTEKECEKKYIPFAFSAIYEWLLTGILENGVFQDFYNLTHDAQGAEVNKSYKESIKDYEQKKKKLDKIMNRYADKYLVLPENVTIEDFLKI